MSNLGFPGLISRVDKDLMAYISILAVYKYMYFIFVCPKCSNVTRTLSLNHLHQCSQTSVQARVRLGLTGIL